MLPRALTKGYTHIPIRTEQQLAMESMYHIICMASHSWPWVQIRRYYGNQDILYVHMETEYCGKYKYCTSFGLLFIYAHLCDSVK